MTHYKQIKLRGKYFILTVLFLTANTCFTQTSEKKPYRKSGLLKSDITGFSTIDSY